MRPFLLLWISHADTHPVADSNRNCETQRLSHPNLPILVNIVPDSEDELPTVVLGTQSPVGSPSSTRYKVPRALAPSPSPVLDRPIKPLPHSKSRNAKRPRRMLETEEQNTGDELPVESFTIASGDCSPKRKSRRKFSTGSVIETLDRRISGTRSSTNGCESGIDLM